MPGALFAHYRRRGRPVEPRVADPALLNYAEHPEAEGRAGLGHYARAVKDPVLVPLLIGLCEDPDAEGLLFGESALHVVDGAALPTLCAKHPTFTIMANADRIGRRLVRRLRAADVETH